MVLLGPIPAFNKPSAIEGGKTPIIARHSPRVLV